MADAPKNKPEDPTKDPTFQRVVQHFLKTPHKPHKPIAKKKASRPKAARESK